MWERGLKPADLVKPLGRSWEKVRQYALDYDDPKRTLPPQDVMERIVILTAGEVRPGHFYPPMPLPEPGPEPRAEVKPADEDWHGRDFLNAGDAT
jgi:hypothetical protein